MPATAAFWTISKLTRPETRSSRSCSGSSPARAACADQLVERVVAAHVLAEGKEPPDASNRPAACRPPVRSKTAWPARRASGRPTSTADATTGPAASGSQREDDIIEAGLAADPAARARHERRGRTRSRRRTHAAGGRRARSPGGRSSRGRPPRRATTSAGTTRPSLHQEADRQLLVVAARAHRDRDVVGDLPGTRRRGSPSAPRPRAGRRAPRRDRRRPSRSCGRHWQHHRRGADHREF